MPKKTASATISDSVPTRPATGPAASAPTKLPAIAAAVHSGKSRFACLASNVDVATVQARVTAIDPAAHRVAFAGGTLSYDKLLLATGASARRLEIPGADLGGVYYLRTLPESEALRAAFTPDARVVIVGAGWIGLETAAAARTAGSAVTVVEPQPGALYGVLGPELGGKRARERQQASVADLWAGAQVEGLQAWGVTDSLQHASSMC